ncbi:unnamed protein product [Fraxinus pennsylvanica]|uniref:Uncharacterized protein n=1 Tax=Fraxinus pennsylvanica TaxID=56036 RepID=A0AAD1ZT07_9LAMI|nr:unnamed protein product [Fraxinus pennsylvanica]
MDLTRSCQQETLQFCSRCQEFYGSPQNHDLCSKCYQDFLKEKTAKTAEKLCFKKTTASPSSSSPSVSTNPLTDCFLTNAMNELTNNETTPLPIVKNRCKSCNKKVGLTGFGCKCGGSFCGMHRYPEAHACKFDFKTPARAVLMKENPVCKGDKLMDRFLPPSMALEWVVLGYVAGAKAIMVLLLTLPGIDPLRKGLISVTRSKLKPFMSVVPFCLFLLMDIYRKYEHRPICESDSCSPSDISATRNPS